MIRVLFICHGNICRSPMAEFIFRKLIADQGLSDCYEVASAATSREEIGNSVYPPAKRELAKHGISCDGKRARQVIPADYDDYDYLIVMEEYNLRNIRRILPNDPDGKICRLLDFTDTPSDIADPWYTGDFELTYRQILEGCTALLDKLQNK